MHFRSGARRVSPARIYYNSDGLTPGCCCGSSRASKNQSKPAAQPIAAHTQNDILQPKRTIMAAIKGGVTAAPPPTLANINPFAMPRSLVGIQLAAKRFELG